MRISRESWSKIQTVIRQYPESCRLITEWEMEVLDATLKARDPTGHKALLLQSDYAKRLTREIAAVEDMLGHFSDCEQSVIRMRFWSGRYVMPYEYMSALPYSERQMHRIISKAIKIVGINLGELNPKIWRM